MTKQAIWFRQDLRTFDNTALNAACSAVEEGVVAVFVITAATWQRHDWGINKVNLVLQQLQDLSDSLAKLNIPLKILQADTFSDTPEALADFCQAHQVGCVHANRQLLLDEMARDIKTEQALEAMNVSLKLYDDLTLLPPDLTTKADGEAFKVFTPFRRQFLTKLVPGSWRSTAQPAKQKKIALKADKVPKSLKAFPGKVVNEIFPAGEKAAQKRLKLFCEHALFQYSAQRDFPAIEGTSQLSAYLAIGVLSVRQCLHTVFSMSDCKNFAELQKHEGAATWVIELIWREFYYVVAYHFTDVVRGKPFRPYTEQLPWSKNKKHFAAWCEGKTGFPLVDAAMRQLNQTGWMHNRLRMVVAMFLSKTLFLDWRLGERYFMQQLTDADFASNNGGWQWSASTGTDSVPYFRIFNPTTQSQRFDKAGDFIRHYCPELATCDAKTIHNPPLALRAQLGYPEPVVDYKKMRAHVMAAFKELKK